MAYLNPCTTKESLGNGRYSSVIHIAPIAHEEALVGGGTRLVANDIPVRREGKYYVATGNVEARMPAILTPGEAGMIVKGGDAGLSLIPMGIKEVEGIDSLDGVGNVIGRRYNGAWAGADYELVYGGFKFSKHIHLDKGHPKVFQFKMSEPLGVLTAKGGNDIDCIKDAKGKTQLTAREAFLYKPDDMESLSIPVAQKIVTVGLDTYIYLILPEGDWAGWVLDPTWVSDTTLGAGIDNSLDQQNATTNYGTGTWDVGSGSSGALARYRAIAKFVLTDLVGKIVISSSLTLQLYGAVTTGIGTYADYSIRRILAGNNNWTESGSCWNTKDGSLSWAGSAGLATSGTDYATTALWGENQPSSTNGSIILTFSPAETQSMVDNNYGILHLGGNSNTGGNINYRGYASSDHATAAYRPYLTVVYEEAGETWAGAGALTSSGTVFFSIAKPLLAGGLGSSGSLSRSISKPLSGAVSWIGTFLRGLIGVPGTVAVSDAAVSVATITDAAAASVAISDNEVSV